MVVRRRAFRGKSLPRRTTTTRGISMRARLLLASLLAASLPTLVLAGPIAGEFTGTVYGINESGATVPGAIGVGTAVTGSFQFENVGQAAYLEQGGGINEPRHVWSSPGSYLRLTITAVVWEAPPLSITARNASEVLSDPDLLSLIFSTTLSSLYPPFPPATSFPGIPAGQQNSGFGI